MLVISRKSGERVHIGDDIEVIVVSLKGNSVRLAIEAPRDIVVLRGELRVHQREQVCAASHLPIE
jgi:carbon storage regulator